MTGQQLKNSILQLAVQGKLVPQDPNDEPASQLLARIREEKEQLIREKKIKREKNPSQIFRGEDGRFYERVGKAEPVCIDEELPFEIPETWEWARWGAIAYSIQYGYNAPAKTSGRIKMVRISDIQNNAVLWDNVPFCDIPEKEISNYLLKANDILFARTGGTVGKSFLVKSVPEESIYAGYLIRTRYNNELSPQYLKYFMESPLYWMQLQVGTTTTAQPNCNGKTLGNMVLPIPPKIEQQRIVAKIEELLPFVERYEQSQTKLKKLNTTFPDQLKKSILQEAIQGKLMPQDPADEPASALLERIHAEKAQLTRDGKIKREKNPSQIFRGEDGHFYERIGKNEPVCIDDQLPFEIPESWEWARLGTALINRDAERIPLSVNERQKLEKIYDYYGASGVIDKVDNFLFDKPLLLIGEDGANLLLRSKPIAFIAKGKYWVNNHAHVLDAIDNTLLEYIALYINAINLAPYVTGTAQPKMNQQKMHSILLTIPPLKEQKRIIAQYNILNQTLEKLYRKD